MSRSARNAPDASPVHVIHAPDAVKRGKRRGRPLDGSAPRVRLFASVAEMTAAQIEVWRGIAECPTVKTGQIIDELVAMGLASRWEPNGGAK